MERIGAADRRARLARRHRLAPGNRAATVGEATHSIAALHATDLTSIYLSAWARVDGFRLEDLDRALYVDRTLVKVMAMRRTLFVVPRDLLTAAVRGAGDRVAARLRRELLADVERAGLVDDADAWFEAVTDAVLARLGDGSDWTLTRLRDEVDGLAGTTSYGEGKRWANDRPVAPRVLAVLTAAGVVVRGHNARSWLTAAPTWTSMEAWLGRPVGEMDPAAARAALVAAWLRGFGPGTDADIVWWLGDTLRDVRAALRTLGAVAVDLDGRPGYVLPDDIEPVEPVEPWAALLPALDPATMGWKERDWYLGDHRAHLFDTAGNGGTTAWWDGRIVGAWHQLRGPDVEVHLLEDVGADGSTALEEEAARLTAWLDGARPGGRWPSPTLSSLKRG